MRESFDKIKRKYTIYAAIFAVCGGILCALLITGGIMLALKLCAVPLGWYFYLLMGVCIAALAGTAVFFIARPNDMRLARRLDKVYCLDEKTQTMIEYSGQEGAVIEMQRADLDNTLANLPKRRPSAVSIVTNAAAVIVAAALFAAAVIVPQRYKAAGVTETPYTVAEWRLTALNTLIADINSDSILDEDLQSLFMGTLEDLYTNLTSEDLTEDLMEDYVHSAMITISSVAADYNTYDEIAYSLSAYAAVNNEFNTYYIAEGLRGAAAAYSDVNANLSSYSVLSTVYSSLLEAIADKKLEPAGESVITKINALTDEDAAEELALFSSGLYGAVSADSLATYRDAITDEFGYYDREFGSSRTFRVSGEPITVYSGDDLYDALYDLYYTVSSSTSYYNGESQSTVYDLSAVVKAIAGDGSDGSGAVNTFVSAATSAMETQAYIYMADVYVRQNLANTFGVSIVSATINDGSDQEEPTEGDGDSEGASGAGGGHGDPLYPNQDLIYNPATGGYDYYYNVITDTSSGESYLNSLYAMLDSDDVSDEMKNFIRSYISSLLTTTETID